MDFNRLIGNFYFPDRRLKNYITGYNISQGSNDPEYRVKLKTIPFGMAGIIILLDNGKMNIYSEWNGISVIKKACVMGYSPIHKEQYIMPSSTLKRGLSISLTQLGVNHLLHLPLRELYQQNIDMELIFGYEAASLVEKLEDTLSEEKMISILDQFFLNILRREAYLDQPFVGLVNRILSNNQQMIKVNELADQMNIHERSLQRKFRDEISLTPKEFLRMNRFIKIINLLIRYPVINIQDLIWRCGFYDQAHFNHEFQKITRYSPGDFYKFIQPEEKNSFIPLHS